MTWKEKRALEERRGFIAEWQRHEESMAELCRRYEISRPTGYKLIERYEAEGEAGVAERSRGPHQRPQAMSEKVAERIVGLRRKHPRWGPRKLKAYLEREEPEGEWPAASSIGELLGREGLTVARRRRRHTPAYSQPLGHAEGRTKFGARISRAGFCAGTESAAIR